MPFNLRDTALKVTKALPNGAATITSDGIQIQDTATNQRAYQGDIELLVTCPALTVTELADTQTITYTIETSDASAFGSGVVVISTTAVQTGAGGAGSAATSLRVRPNTDVKAYVRAKAVKTGASNASTSSLTFEVLA